jgi:Ca-activated chloride channel family protein
VGQVAARRGFICLIACAIVAVTTPAVHTQDRATRPATADPIDVQLEPADGALITGPTTMRADVRPEALAASVTFFVDGRQICAVAQPPFACDWHAGGAIAAHTIRVVVNLASGGRVVRTVRTAAVPYAETVDVDMVQVTASVADADGRPVTALPRSAFQVFENGRPQVIQHFASAEAPLELVVAVDVSASLRETVPALRRAVANFLESVPTRHRVTVVGFNDEVFTLARHTTDVESRRHAVASLSPWGATVLYDAIIRGVDMLGHGLGRRALVVFTDGEDQGSRATLDDVERALGASDVSLYIVAQGRGVTSVALQRVMERLCRPTGGRSFFTARIDALQNAFDELLVELSSQYLLAYQPDSVAAPGEWRSIDVRVGGQPRVRARQGYRTNLPR